MFGKKVLSCAQGTLTWPFPPTTQNRIFYDHDTFSILSLYEKVKQFHGKQRLTLWYLTDVDNSKHKGKVTVIFISFAQL